jgi:hypothetical protein
VDNKKDNEERIKKDRLREGQKNRNMAFQDMVGGDCSGSNPLLKLVNRGDQHSRVIPFFFSFFLSFFLFLI